MDDKWCIICGETRTEGLVVCHKFICQDCERKIVETAVLDERYDHIVTRLKKIWDGVILER